MRLCVLCRHALAALAQWQEARPCSSLDALIAELPAFHPNMETAELAPSKKIA